MPIQQIAPEEAHRLLGGGHRYIDVRTEPEFAAGHPAGAVNIPVAVVDPATGQMALNPEFAAVVEKHFAKDAPLILGCQSGMRSQRAAEILARTGFTNLANMQGGFGGARDPMGGLVFPGWADCGLPTCADCGEENQYRSLRR